MPYGLVLSADSDVCMCGRIVDHAKDKPTLVPAHLVQDQLKKMAKGSGDESLLETPFADLIAQGLQEVAANPPDVALALRPSIGVWEYVHISTEDFSATALSIPEYLGFKERLVGGWLVLAAVIICAVLALALT